MFDANLCEERIGDGWLFHVNEVNDIIPSTLLCHASDDHDAYGCAHRRRRRPPIYRRGDVPCGIETVKPPTSKA